MQETLFKAVGTLDEHTYGMAVSKAEATLEVMARVFSAHISEQAILDEHTFWNMIRELNKEIRNTMPLEKKDNRELWSADIELATDRFVWEYAHGSKAGSFSDVLEFIKTYNKKARALYKPLFNVIEGYGDDGYGDMLDAFPLLGKERYDNALEGIIEGDSENQYQGENYIKMKLEDAAFKYFNSLMEKKAHRRVSEDEYDSRLAMKNEIRRNFGLEEQSY